MKESCSLSQKQIAKEVLDPHDVLCDSCKSALLISDKINYTFCIQQVSPYFKQLSYSTTRRINRVMQLRTMHTGIERAREKVGLD
jgi:hypothetical protein